MPPPSAACPAAGPSRHGRTPTAARTRTRSRAPSSKPRPSTPRVTAAPSPRGRRPTASTPEQYPRSRSGTPFRKRDPSTHGSGKGAGTRRPPYPRLGRRSHSNAATFTAKRPRPGEARRERPAACRPSLDAGHVHPAQFLFQFADLVAQPNSHLELQLARSPKHLVVELLDEVGKFGARHGGDVELAVGVRAHADDAGRTATATARHCRLAARL